MLSDNYFFSFSNAAQNEIHQHVKSQNENINVLKSSCFLNEIELIRRELETGNRFVIIKPLINFLELYTLKEQREIHWLIGNALGEPLIQNEEGEKSVLVYDRNKHNSVKEGARYHQTHEGGIFHTDNVNVPFKWHYLLFACISPSYVGGESIIVNGINIYKTLQKNYPEVLSILEGNFLWEQRGMIETFNQAPIISYDEHGEVEFRYLRPYMESAHKKLNVPLTDAQIHALDTFEALLLLSENQLRHTFSKGEILLTFDSQILHDRTHFTDHPLAVSLPEWEKDNSLFLKRTMDRLWIRKGTNVSAL